MNRLEELNCKKTRRCRLKALTMLAAVCAVHAGCTPGHRLETASARGTVTLDGVPLSAGSVVLLPERGRSASSVLAKDGSFVLSTYGSGDGAIVGKHKVVVYPLASDSESNTPPPGYVPVPARYQNAATSSLEVEVKAGTENVFELKLVDMSSNGG
jgi:hypothetical protein